jgi:cytidine deaminase
MTCSGYVGAGLQFTLRYEGPGESCAATSGHGFNRAASRVESTRLQPLRPVHIEKDTQVTEYDHLIAVAKQTRENAHAPYSNFRVGAALRATSGRIFGGCNVENATYGLTICAERTAIFKAISEGERGFDAIAVVTDTDALTSPCGACRQLIWEFCGDIPVILCNLKGKTEVIPMRTLFPKPFDSSSL